MRKSKAEIETNKKLRRICAAYYWHHLPVVIEEIITEEPHLKDNVTKFSLSAFNVIASILVKNLFKRHRLEVRK